MNLLNFFLDLLYPPRCMFCGKILSSSEKSFCRKCKERLPGYLIKEPRYDLKNIKSCVAAFEYRDAVRESLHRYKFGDLAAYGPVYADFIAKSIDEKGISCDIISWVPLSRKSLRKRGYDQAEIIARSLSEKLGLPCERLFVKVKNNKRQSSINNREKRFKNVSGVYRCISTESLAEKRVLIVDDIVTTGASLCECAKELKKLGCSEIYAAVAASSIL